ncbi:class I glutamine amidotransferase-like protein [Leucogyrophana mollusca]|uniref:Class I glutamine amidotransferase-like protein n=1 Tax=Leucogyrophana mollusca TaxID=85980 RepID=A0ACB8B8X4_9AGAM|nr:class I glutamine amidotransferase-like protein [Leucogyrophana mollusca]
MTSPLPPHAKIALLICDPTSQDFIDGYGNITNLFTSLYTRFLLRLAGDQEVSPAGVPALPGPVVVSSFNIDTYRAIDGELPTNVDEYNSIIVSGSGHSANDTDAWIGKLAEFLNDTAVRHPKVRLIGVCFGHQIISRSVFAGKLEVGVNPKGWEIGPYNVTLNAVGKRLFTGATSLNIEMFHHDAVFKVPTFRSVPKDTPHIWGSSEKTTCQGIISLYEDAEDRGKLDVDNIHIFTSQGHPELSQGMTLDLLNLYEEEVGPEAVKEARARIDNFKGTIDWYQLTKLMWAISTRHTIDLPASGGEDDLTADDEETPKVEAPKVEWSKLKKSNEGVFVLVL